MANRALRPCCYPGCTELVSRGYCDKHRKPNPTGKYHNWYCLPIWTQMLRPGQLLREPFCRECAKYGIRTEATDVDHIEPFKGDWGKFTDRDNLQSLCHSCHSRKTAREIHAPRF